MQKTIPGVLGGMGPLATVDFMARVVAQTSADCDQDHLRLLVDHNPGVPNRHEVIGGDDKAVKSALQAMARGLENSGADFLLMVCNTAHAFESDIREVVDIPFVSVVEEVVSELGSHWPQMHNIGVMAAEGCLAAGLYQEALLEAGKEPVTWSATELAQFMSLVYRIKAGETLDELRLQMEQLAQKLVERGAEILIAGCTEIPLVLSAVVTSGDLQIPVLSSTDVLVQRTIDYALGKKDLPTA